MVFIIWSNLHYLLSVHVITQKDFSGLLRWYYFLFLSCFLGSPQAWGPGQIAPFAPPPLWAALNTAMPDNTQSCKTLAVFYYKTAESILWGSNKTCFLSDFWETEYGLNAFRFNEANRKRGVRRAFDKRSVSHVVSWHYCVSPPVYVCSVKIISIFDLFTV